MVDDYNELNNLITQLHRDEGYELHVYLDSKGIPTAGVGHNLLAHPPGFPYELGMPISPALIDQWLRDDIDRAEQELFSHCPWANDIDSVRQGVLLNMCFNMGWGDGQHGLSSFYHFLAMVQAGNYDGAAAAMLESEWAGEAGARATRLSEQMRKGEWT